MRVVGGLGVSTTNLDVINVAVPAFFGNVSKVLTAVRALAVCGLALVLTFIY